MTAEEFKELMNSWVYQKKGTINKYNEKTHPGTQPIRVNNNMLVMMFGHSYPGFLTELKKQIEEGKLNPKIDFVFAEEAIRHDTGFHTPRVAKESRMIQLHETFLSYLWCITYAIYILYLETVDYPAMNKIAGYEKYPVSESNIAKARALFDYGKSLIAFYSGWDKEQLPNPEIYLAEERNYPEQTSLFYTDAVKFILSHEYTHLKLHIDQIDENTPESYYQAFEYEADNAAIKNSLKGATKDSIYAVSGGIIIGILSMFFFKATTSGEKHPDAEDRLTNALEQLPDVDNELSWGFACMGLELWDEQFGHHFEKLGGELSKKELYFHYIKQIKSRKQP
ncbi:hypothetical protein FHW88_002771 [Mucilaginibacter sp. SG538B]|uniref:phage exclusion protein Lit family protein n=1 Tax=Mucilaginibacter sp. SG538B TaxID=2587021 RepID=UPI00159DB0EA|nr:phage exclusion protein Lit family protein [Mucilaginibacter sp. SG538B]NVM64482.1 hypothetical protein [Mucilaginibacter sp. SG538B]